MLTKARYTYTENSTFAVQYLTVALALVAAAAFALHAAAWLLGANVSLFDTPAVLTALHPIMSAMVLPGIGWMLGLVASWFLGDDSEDGVYRCAGNALGQLACLLALSSALAL